MKHSIVLAAFGLLVFAPIGALAGPCDAQFSFDGSLTDSSGSHHGQMLAADNAPVSPQFAPGRSGQALRLDGASVMRSLIDLHPDICPQVTITAWISVESIPEPRAQSVLSTGNGGSPGLRIMGADSLQMTGRANGIYARNVPLAGSGWTFVALVYDYPNDQYRFHWRGRDATKAIGGAAVVPRGALWVGAFNDSLTAAAQHVLIDDLQVMGTALDAQAVTALRDADPAGTPTAEAAQSIAAEPSSAGGACASNAQCPAGSYCAADGSCHPDSHLPMTNAGGGSSLAGLQQQLSAQNAARTGDISYESPSALLDGATSSDETSSSSAGGLMAPSADYSSGIDRRSPTDILANAETTADTNDSASSSASPPQGGTGSLSVREYLEMQNFAAAATGNVRDCTSFSEVVRDLAAGFRDAVVRFAQQNSCGLLERPMHATRAASNVTDEQGYRAAALVTEVLSEAYDECIATTSAASRLPDSMVGFWNSITGSDTWATIGPRQLQFGRDQTGNLIAPGDRKFISVTPFLGNGSVYLDLEESDGRARVTARVCSVGFDNYYQRLVAFSVNETPEERDDQAQRILQDLGNLRNKFLIVYLDAAGIVGQNFRYRLRAE